MQKTCTSQMEFKVLNCFISGVVMVHRTHAVHLLQGWFFILKERNIGSEVHIYDYIKYFGFQKLYRFCSILIISLKILYAVLQSSIVLKIILICKHQLVTWTAITGKKFAETLQKPGHPDFTNKSFLEMLLEMHHSVFYEVTMMSFTKNCDPLGSWT